MAMTRKQLTQIAHTIIDRQFPGEWNRFKTKHLPVFLDSYEEDLEIGFSEKEALLYFKIFVFQFGKWGHEESFDTPQAVFEFTPEDEAFLMEFDDV